MKRSTFKAFVCFLILTAAQIAFADERITRYESVVSVARNASATVTERITFNIEGKKIRHGIVRVFPVKYRTATGAKRRTGFELLSVTLDGKEVPYKVSWERDDAEIRIGDPVVRAPLGEHTYELTFRVTGHVRFLEDRDAVYWNVTGNDWEFPIDYASFRLELSEGGERKILAFNAYTGYSGESGADFKSDGLFFETARPLKEKEGFTVAVDWEKGFIEPPSLSALGRFAEFFSDNRGFAAVLWPVLILLYFIPIWRWLGKDPALGTVVPMFDPPEGMEPGTAALVRNMDVVPECLTSNLTQLAVLGFVKFGFEQKKKSKENGAVLISKTAPSSEPLAKPLSSLFNLLFPNGKQSCSVSSENARKSCLAEAYENMGNYYEKRGEKLHNHHYSAGCVGFALFAACVFLAADWYPLQGLGSSNIGVLFIHFLIELLFRVVIDGFCDALGIGYFRGPEISDLLVFFVFSMIANLVFVRYGVQWFRNSHKARTGPGRFIKTTFGVFLVLAGIAGNLFLLSTDGYLAVAFVASSALFYLFAAKLMPVRSQEGVELLRQIEGLSMYVNAEKEFLAQMNAPEDTTERYEKILPYAIALGAAESWNERFGPLLERYEPSWSGVGIVETLGLLYGLDRTARLFRRSGKSSFARSVTTWTGGSGTSGGSSGGGSGGGGGKGW
jgi:uncharacterized membrane protein YgcG